MNQGKMHYTQVVLDTTKVQIFKQITTKIAEIPNSVWLF